MYPTLAITLTVGGFTLTRRHPLQCATTFPLRVYTVEANGVTPFIAANAEATRRYQEEPTIGPFLRAYDALLSSQAVRRSVRCVAVEDA